MVTVLGQGHGAHIHGDSFVTSWKLVFKAASNSLFNRYGVSWCLCKQLRYYDQQQDESSKDIIDLKDVVAVTPLKNVQGAPKKADENAFFEVGLGFLDYVHVVANVASDSGFCVCTPRCRYVWERNNCLLVNLAKSLALHGFKHDASHLVTVIVSGLCSVRVQYAHLNSTVLLSLIRRLSVWHTRIIG